MEGISYYESIINACLHEDLLSKIIVEEFYCKISFHHKKLFQHKLEMRFTYFSQRGLFARLDNIIEVIEKEFIDFGILENFRSDIRH